MSETAPLSSAHTHARKAAEELEKVHFAEAAYEHQQASTNFAKAARGTSDVEALRVLKLLEEQHQRLARTVKSRDSPIVEVPADDSPSAEHQPTIKDKSTTSPPRAKSATSKSKSTTSALASARVGSHARDSSPSLAREIATRRGIPQPGRAQPSAAAQARARQLSPESRRRSAPGGSSKVPPSIVDSQADLRQTRNAKKAEDDEGFAKFYSNITTGTMSKLSSVLAYAGLPLTADDAAQLEQSSRPRSEKTTVSASNDPDVKSIFSKAALDAIEEEHRQRGTLGHGFGPAESFYVVQTSGGTHSYADIAKAQQQQLASVDEDDEGDFVDANEVPGPPSPARSRLSQKKRNSFGSRRTEEELELENGTLKTTLEQLASRLAAFEAHAQDASMAALSQSMASIKQAPTGGARPDSTIQDRLQQLEKQIEQQVEERQKLQAYSAKQERDLKKYRSKWDELKKGAREKEKAKQEKKTVLELPGDGVVGE